MPDWSNTPPTCPHDMQYRLIRAPAARSLHCVMLAEKPIGCPTHYWKGRTMPCETANCEPCQLGIPWRWHSYTPIQIWGSNEKCILELTAQASEQLGPALAEFQSLRGVEIVIDRPSRRPNGRVRIVVAPARRPEGSLPPCPNTIACMSHIWGTDDRPLATQPGKLGTNRILVPPNGNGDKPSLYTPQL
jgi:hypothetical protein